MATIEPLNASNYSTWREKVTMLLALGELDYALENEKPTEPVPGSDDYDQRVFQFGFLKIKWERSNNKCLMI